MNVQKAAELLQNRIGLDPLSLGSNMLANIIAARMRVLKLKDAASYAAHLQQSSEELATLIEEVVVPETWFFRSGKIFSFLAERVRQATQGEPRTGVYRILSAPCSSGEEPYSMVMALREAAIPCERWTVEGIDVSARNLTRARQGIYREISFRETPEALRRKYFHEATGGWQLDVSLREKVRYRTGNLVDPHLLRGEPPFDLIFCRNVLIYLNAEARKQVLANLDRLLAANGLLCMGHAEPLHLLDPRFQAIHPHSYFLFERRPVAERRPTIAARSAPALPPKRPTIPTGPRSARRAVPSVVSPAPVAKSAPVDLLLQARREADGGALDQALQLCQGYLTATQPSAAAYSLMGVIHQSRHEQSQAVECFRRALYLDPQHEEALLHLLLLYQEQGNEAAAQRLRQRLERKTAGGKA